MIYRLQVSRDNGKTFSNTDPLIAVRTKTSLNACFLVATYQNLEWSSGYLYKLNDSILQYRWVDANDNIPRIN